MATIPHEKYPDFLPLEREFIGYGNVECTSPDPAWPGAAGGAKVALSIMVNYNTGAERSTENGDDGGEPFLPDIPIRVKPVGRRFDMLESAWEYGGREGLPRLLRLFEKYNMKATFNVSTQALEKAPYYAKVLASSPHELACAGKRYIDYMHVAPKQEEKDINEAIETLQMATGDRTLPHTWCVGRPSNISPLLYARAHHERSLPLYASSDTTSDELPYWTPSPLATVDGLEDKGMLNIPFTLDTGDHRFVNAGSGWASPKDFYEYLVDTFDCLYEEGENGQAKLMSIQLHPHVIGHGGRIYYLEKFLQYIREKGDNVWVARRDEIAQHWAAKFPYSPSAAFGQTKNPECW